MDTPVVQPPPPKNNSGILINFFLLFLGILIGLALGKTTLLSGLRIPYLGATPTPTLLPTPTPPPDITANWKTYTNDQYGFSFKYPSDWENITSTQAITNSNREFMLQTSRGEFVNGTVFDQKSQSQDTSWSKHVLLPNGKELIIVYVDNIGPGSKGGTKDIQIFTQILSTFTFVGQTGSSNPNLKTYTNNQFGFSFNYPSSGYNLGVWEPAENILFSLSLLQITNQTAPQSPEVGVSVYNNLNSQPLSNWISTYTSGGEFFFSNHTNLKDYQVGGKNGKYFEIQAMGVPGVYVVTQLDNTKVLGIHYTKMGPNVSSLESVFNQVISSFKFTQ